jgi:glucose/arabinose dehydrogenase
LRRGALRKILIVITILILLLSSCISNPTSETTGAPLDIDSDDDGWTDAQEETLKTNPYQIDSDGDGIIDPLDPNPLIPEPIETIPPSEEPSKTVAPQVTSSTTTTTKTITTTLATPEAPEPPNPEDYELSKIADGFKNPVYLTHAGDESDRLFIVEQRGYIWILDNKLTKINTPFLDLSSRVKSGGERGLLGLVFHPTYSVNGFFYAHYSDQSGDTVISRFKVTDNPNLADPNSEEILLKQDQPFGNHNGGQIAFGPDGYLYIGLGDGGAAGDPLGNGQDPSKLLGSILRINVDDDHPYSIPLSNPFVSDPKGMDEVWAYGLRNPWRFSFDRLTGDLYIGDVGQNKMEEINYHPSEGKGGENYGWNQMEGSDCFIGGCSPELYVEPVAVYSHNDGCSVTGGYVYRGKLDPTLYGTYFYGDYCSGLIWTLFKIDEVEWINTVLKKTSLTISSFGEDEAGELYVVDYGGGIYLIKRIS